MLSVMWWIPEVGYIMTKSEGISFPVTPFVLQLFAHVTKEAAIVFNSSARIAPSPPFILRKNTSDKRLLKRRKPCFIFTHFFKEWLTELAWRANFVKTTNFLGKIPSTETVHISFIWWRVKEWVIAPSVPLAYSNHTTPL